MKQIILRELNWLIKTNTVYGANALNLWAISQKMPAGKHEHIKTYDLESLKDNILIIWFYLSWY